jgi:hypothetical protein
MVCAIHQPNFFPWRPFFQKMEECDVFVILTECQFEKNNFQNRFKQEGLYREWNTFSVNSGLEPIKNKRYLHPAPDYDIIKNNLPDYEYILNYFTFNIKDDSSSLMYTNIAIIRVIAELLGIDKSKIVVDYPTELTGTERLIDICKKFNCNTYLSGSGGAKQYLNQDLFKHHDIKLIFQDETTMIKKPILECLTK